MQSINLYRLYGKNFAKNQYVTSVGSEYNIKMHLKVPVSKFQYTIQYCKSQHFQCPLSGIRVN